MASLLKANGTIFPCAWGGRNHRIPSINFLSTSSRDGSILKIQHFHTPRVLLCVVYHSEVLGAVGTRTKSCWRILILLLIPYINVVSPPIRSRSHVKDPCYRHLSSYNNHHGSVVHWDAVLTFDVQNPVSVSSWLQSLYFQIWELCYSDGKYYADAFRADRHVYRYCYRCIQQKCDWSFLQWQHQHSAYASKLYQVGWYSWISSSYMVEDLHIASGLLHWSPR